MGQIAWGRTGMDPLESGPSSPGSHGLGRACQITWRVNHPGCHTDLGALIAFPFFGFRLSALRRKRGRMKAGSVKTEWQRSSRRRPVAARRRSAHKAPERV